MTKIEWTRGDDGAMGKTWNPIRGCSVVSPGCTNCYAMRQAHRFSGAGQSYEWLTEITKGGPVWTGKVRLVPELLDAPLRWRKPRRVFVNSMSDLFHEAVSDEFIAAVFGAMAAAPQHTFQVLTKRPERMRRWFEWLSSHGGLGPYIRNHADVLRNYFASGSRTETYRGRVVRSNADALAMVLNAAACIGAGPLPYVWLGVSCEDQTRADERIPLLLQTPAAVHFVSAEPLLGPIDFDSTCEGDPCSSSFLTGIDGERVYDGHKCALDWVIVGGESGPHARRCNLDWIQEIVRQCREAGVSCFVKQLGAKLQGDFRYFPNADGSLGDGIGSLPWHPDGDACRTRNDPKGGDPSEWPDDLRVREFPSGR